MKTYLFYFLCIFYSNAVLYPEDMFYPSSKESLRERLLNVSESSIIDFGKLFQQHSPSQMFLKF